MISLCAIPSRPCRSPPGEASIREERAQDFLAREALLDRSFGTGRWRKTCERLRENRLPAPGLAFSAVQDRVLVGTLRFWSIDAGGVDALMLGPIAVGAAQRSQGLGGKLIRLGLFRAKELGHRAVFWLAMRPITSVSAFSALAPRGWNCRGRSIRRASSRWNCSPARWPAPADWCARPARWSPRIDAVWRPDLLHTVIFAGNMARNEKRGHSA